MNRFFSVILAAMMFFLCCVSNKKADIVIINAKIWTADDKNRYAEAVAVKGDKIIAVGTTEEIYKYISTETRIINLNGRRIVPGFQDSHTHFFTTAAMTTASEKNPYTPEFNKYDDTTAYIKAGVTGLMHLTIKYMNSTPMDIDIDFSFPTFEKAAERIKYGIHELHKMGITTVFELGADWKHYEVLSLLKKRGELKIRTEIYMASRHLDELIERNIKMDDGDEWVRILGVKFYADGWLSPRTCSLKDQYSDAIFPWQFDPEYRGILFIDQDKADKDILKAHKAGLKIAVHTIGDNAVEVILNAYEKISGEYPFSNRHTLEHVSMINPGLIRRIKELNVISSIQFSFATSDMYFVDEAIGQDRSEYTYAWKTLLYNKIICSGGSDFPTETISPLWGIQRIVTRQEINGEPEGGWHPEQCISVEEALRLITINSAYSSFEEDIKGSIEKGKLADMVVLSRDILEIPKNEIADVKVNLTMVGGEIVYVSPDFKLEQ